MIRASSAGRICTNRPKFDIESLNTAVAALNKKVGEDFDMGQLDTYLTTRGIMTLAKAVKKELENQKLAEEDPLPDGAKSYLQERWLELNYDFVDTAQLNDSIPTLKGNIVEEEAIAMASNFYGIPYEKNDLRKTEDFITGECDVKYIQHNVKIIRDNKSPETWRTFRAKKGIPSDYHWQLIAYCYLYGAEVGYLDYTLMPTPPELIPMMTKNMSDISKEKFFKMEERVLKMPVSQRIKTYMIDRFTIQEDLKFFKARLLKAKEYYNNLTYDICMGIYKN